MKKRCLIFSLIFSFLMSNLFSFNMVNAAQGLPKVNLAGLKASYYINETPSVKVSTSNYSGSVQYKIFVYDMRKQKNSSNVTNGYTKLSYSASQKVSFTVSGLSSGVYKLYVLVKKSGSTSTYDNYSTKTFTVFNTIALNEWGSGLTSKKTYSSIIVNASNTVLNDVNTQGNIIINTGKNGVTYLNKVSAKNILVKSCGKKGLILNGSSVSGKLTIASGLNDIGVIASNKTKITSTVINSNSTLTNNTGSFGNITVKNSKKGKTSVINLKGKFDQVITLASPTIVNTDSSASGIKLLVASQANDNFSFNGKFNSIEIKNPAKVTLGKSTIISDEIKVNTSARIVSLNRNTSHNVEITSKAKGAKVSLTGKFKTLEVKAATQVSLGNNSNVNKLVTQEKVVISSNSTSSIDSVETSNKDDIKIEGNTSQTLQSLSTDIKLSCDGNITLNAGDDLTIEAQDSPSDSLNTVKSSDDKVVSAQVTGNKIELKANTSGSAEITVTASKTGLISSEVKIYVTVQGINTKNGELNISPSTLAANSDHDLILSYTLGEKYNKGKVIFNIPAGFTPQATDKVSIAGGQATVIGTSAIKDQTVTISNITCDPSKTVTLTLVKTHIPFTGVYNFSASGDADGDINIKNISAVIYNEIKSLNVVNYIQTQRGELSVSSTSLTGADEKQTVIIAYKLGEDYDNGRIVFTLPDGFKATNKDAVIIGNTNKQIADNQIINNDVTVNGITAKKDDIVSLKLQNCTLPSSGNYIFKAVGDADADKNGRIQTDGEDKEIAQLSLGSSQTKIGALSVTPLNGNAASVKDITVDYKLGEAYRNGSLYFTLPQGFTMLATDTVSINGSVTDTVIISGQNIVVNNVTAESGQIVTLKLIGKTLPTAGTYSFNVVGDADGAGISRLQSEGVGSEVKIFVSVAVPTGAGNLSLTPETEKSFAYATKLTLVYTLGEDFNNGKVSFILPLGFYAASNDTYSISGGTPVPITASTNNQELNICNVTAKKGQTVSINFAPRRFPGSGDYSFIATGDSDGDEMSKMPSPGTGAEIKVLKITPAATVAGVLYISPESGYTTTTIDTIELKYIMGDYFSSGKVIFTLPSGFTPSLNDTVKIGSNVEAKLEATSISGQTVTINNITAVPGDVISLKLFNRKLPSASKYTFNVKGDADGNGTDKLVSAGTDNETKDFIVNSITDTKAGTLTLNPSESTALLTQQTIVLTYSLGENYNNGKVVFIMPSEFKAIANDTYVIGYGDTKLITQDMINGQNLTISNITASANDTIKVSLLNRTLPITGTYKFKSYGDADSESASKNPSSGVGDEVRSIQIDPSNTVPGVLTITPDIGYSTKTVDSILLKYSLGDYFVNGKVTFTLPQGFIPTFNDEIKIGDQAAVKLDPKFINGQVVTISNITGNAGEEITLNLLNRTLPSAGNYTFTVNADADGNNVNKLITAGRGNETTILKINPMTATAVGTLIMTPESGARGSIEKTISLTYILGESYNKGSVTFVLPSNFKASVADCYTSGDDVIKQITQNQLIDKIDVQNLVISNITAAQGQLIKVYLKNKTLPDTGAYKIIVQGDADGDGTSRTQSNDGTNVTSNELRTFTVMSTPTATGVLTMTPECATSTATATLTLDYVPGEKMNNGTVEFSLPTPFTVNDMDTITVTGGSIIKLGSQDYDLSNETIIGYQPFKDYGCVQIEDAGSTLVIKGLTTASAYNTPPIKIELKLKNKIMPSAWNYSFSATADSDGDGGSKSPSLGTGNDVFVFSSNSSAPGGRLTKGSEAETVAVSELVSGEEYQYVVSNQVDTPIWQNAKTAIAVSGIIDNIKPDAGGMTAGMYIHLRHSSLPISNEQVIVVTKDYITPAVAPSAGIVKGTLSGTIDLINVSSNMEYKIGSNAYMDCGGTIVSGIHVNINDIIYVRVKETTDKPASTVQSIQIKSENIKEADAPLVSVVIGSGSITIGNASSTMEYAVIPVGQTGTIGYTAIPSGSSTYNIIDLAPGDYDVYVRYSSANGQPASACYHITITI